MGSLFKSKTETTKSPFENNPWIGQVPALTKGMEGGMTALDNAMGQNAAITDFTADLTSGQQGVLSSASDFAGSVMPMANGVMSAGANAAGGVTQFASNAGDIYNRAGANRTDQILADGSRMAANPYMQGQIDSALGDVRKAFDQDLAGINSGASGTGNINSSRAGVVEALSRDDAMDRGASISANMRSQAYRDGMSMASDNINNGFNQQLGANGQLGESAGMGMDMLTGGYALGSGALSDRFNTESVQQNQAQAEIDGARARGMSELDILKQYMGVVGGSHGSSGFTSETSKTPSMFQQLLGGATSLMGAWGGMK